MKFVALHIHSCLSVLPEETFLLPSANSFLAVGSVMNDLRKIRLKAVATVSIPKAVHSS